MFELIHRCVAQRQSLWGEGGAGGEGADRNDSLLDPTRDPDTTWGDMSEDWHHPTWSREYPDGSGW
jgi:hypothetical protein